MGVSLRIDRLNIRKKQKWKLIEVIYQMKRILTKGWWIFWAGFLGYWRGWREGGDFQDCFFLENLKFSHPPLNHPRKMSYIISKEFSQKQNHEKRTQLRNSSILILNKWQQKSNYYTITAHIKKSWNCKAKLQFFFILFHNSFFLFHL